MDGSKLPPLLLLFLLQILYLTSAQLLPIIPTNDTRVYIVHVQHPDWHDMMGEERDEFYHSFLPNATLASGEPRMVFTYSHVISGFAAHLTAEEANALESMDGFLFAHPDKFRPLHTTYTPHFLGLDQYNSLWAHSNKGEGVIIAVFDTGILPNHPSFADTLGLPEPKLDWHGRCDLPKGSGTCNNKLIGAQQFVGHAFFGDDPIDTEGHGTHVAGIAAGTPVERAHANNFGDGTASGMAPRSHIAAYKVCTRRGCPDSNSLKAFDQAILDGVDVIQISNGASSPFAESGNIKGSFWAINKKIPTVCSAQNEGPKFGVVSNDAPWILTVGASTTGRRNTAILKLGNGMEFVGESAFSGSNTAEIPLAYPGVVRTDVNLACQNGSMSGIIATGKMVICGTGFNDPVEKAKIAKEAGAAAIIVVNQVWDGDTIRSYQFPIPGIHVTHKDALKIVNYFFNEQDPTGSIRFQGTEFGVRPSPSVASFSSRGPGRYNGNILKPDVVAPGVDILSAWPFDADGAAKPEMFDFKSGTSMAAPHVSGIIALLRNARPHWSPAMIKSALMTTAYTVDTDGNPITDDASNNGSIANAFAVGAGHVNPSAALDPGLVYDTPLEDYVPYLCGLRGMRPRDVTLFVKKMVSCSKKIEAEDLNYPSILVSLGATKKKKTIRRTVTNVGAAGSTYKAKVVEPLGVKIDVNPETLHFASLGEEKNFTVQISLTGNPPVGSEAWDGSLVWLSGRHEVRSPIVITK